MTTFLERITAFLEHTSEDLVVEALFRKGYQQREALRDIADDHEVNLHYIAVQTTVATCLERVEQDADQSEERCAARLRIIRELAAAGSGDLFAADDDWAGETVIRLYQSTYEALQLPELY